MQQSSDEEPFDHELTLARHLQRRVEEQGELLRECSDWLDDCGARGLPPARNQEWAAFRHKLTTHLGARRRR